MVSSTSGTSDQRSVSRDMRKLLVTLSLLLPYKARFLGAMTALVLVAGTVLLIGQGLKHVIDEGLGTNNAAEGKIRNLEDYGLENRVQTWLQAD